MSPAKIIISDSAAFSVLTSLSLEMHAQMAFDTAPFNLLRFARQMSDSNMILASVDLTAYQMRLTDALTNHPQRTISALMIQTIYRNLLVLQDLAKKAVSS
jgi:hypothetical protein